ncbi:MAG: hypothetical protein ACRCVJ_12085 [Clostridium sp.]|uniref:hypothetical protein n=1 Tax=Clostridium sp. TaxID=1506 RepID=UPI003F3FA845
MERELILDGEKLKFKMTNKTVFDIDDKYDNAGSVLNGILKGKKLYNSSLQILSASCITRELEIEELIDKLTPDQVTDELVSIALDIYLDYKGIKLSDKTEEIVKEEKPKKKEKQK